MIFGGGTTSVVVIGMTSVGGNPVVDTTAGIEVGVSDAVGEGTSEENAAGEQADRSSVRNRSVRIIFAISA